MILLGECSNGESPPLRSWCAVTRSRARVPGQHARKKVLNRLRRRQARKTRSGARKGRSGGDSDAARGYWELASRDDLSLYLTLREAQHALSDGVRSTFSLCTLEVTDLREVTC